MTSDQILTLIVAFLGIAGTAVATTLSARLTRKSDAERTRLEAQNRRDEILFEARRRLFVKFLRLSAREIDMLGRLYLPEGGIDEDGPWHKATKLEGEFWILEGEIDLLAPELALKVAEVRDIASDFRLLEPDQEDFEEEKARLKAALTIEVLALTNDMRIALGVGTEGAHNQPQLNEDRMSGNNLTKPGTTT